MVKPISPKDVVTAKQESLPDQVMEAFNELIAENWKESHSKFKQKEVLMRIKIKFQSTTMTEDQILDNNWLDVEEVYRKAGWNVIYDSPAYNESYEPTFEFSKESKK